ncbi:cyclodeaminase/cyclohydrolase family protein [Candidatus Micrarchaeota archaeon]|nr:cyclodeaminase/cyclohydrolase family protein [Candidatus Micrarchaeota archaeon]
MKVYKFLDELASSSPTPGGGSASALLCSIGASLICMVCSLTIRKKGYEQSEAELKKILEEAEILRKKAEELIDEDAKAFNDVMEAYKTPKENPLRSNIIQEALRTANSTPLQVAEIGIRVLELSRVVAFKGNVKSISDVGVAVLAANGGVRGSLLNVRVNLQAMKDDMPKGELLTKLRNMEELTKILFDEVNGIILFKLRN